MKCYTKRFCKNLLLLFTVTFNSYNEARGFLTLHSLSFCFVECMHYVSLINSWCK